MDLICGFPRKIHGSCFHSSSSSRFRFALRRSSSNNSSYEVGPTVLVRLSFSCGLKVVTVRPLGSRLIWGLCCRYALRWWVPQWCQKSWQLHFHKLTGDSTPQALHFCFLSRSCVWNALHAICSTCVHLGHRKYTGGRSAPGWGSSHFQVLFPAQSRPMTDLVRKSRQKMSRRPSLFLSLNVRLYPSNIWWSCTLLNDIPKPF